MSKRRKVLLVLGGAAAVLVIAALTALHILWSDEPPPDDSMLIVHRLDIPDEENGLTYLTQAAAAVYWPGTKAWDEAGLHPVALEEASTDDPHAKAAADIDSKVDAMRMGKEWDATLAAEILDHNAKSIELFQRAMACPGFQRPRPVDIGTALPPIGNELHLGRMLTLRAHALAKEGRDEAALAQAVEVVQYGHALERSKGNLVSFLIGLTAKEFGLEATRSLLKTAAPIPPERLKTLADRVGAGADSSEGLAEALRGEYQWGIEMVEQAMKQAQDKVAKSRGMDPQAVQRSGAVSWFGFAYRPQETRRLLMDQIRPAVEAAGMPLAETHLRDPRAEPQPGRFGQILRGNMIGHGLCSILMPSVISTQKLKCRSNTSGAVTQALLALKAFKAKTGRLPQSLDELVPEFLLAVPLDDFDGKPIRFSLEKKVVYSVGEDFKDGGGMTREDGPPWWSEHKRTAEAGPLGDDEDPEYLGTCRTRVSRSTSDQGSHRKSRREGSADQPHKRKTPPRLTPAVPAQGCESGNPRGGDIKFTISPAAV